MALIRRRRRPDVTPVGPGDFEVLDVDPFAHAGLDDELPTGDVVLPLARLARDADALRSRIGALGVRLPSDTRLPAVQPFLGMLARIEIEFPKFTDGRGYTLGRRLRDQAGYAGELCAVGDVLRDQLLYMHRAGFDAFAVPAHKSAEEALGAFAEMSVFYQAAHDQPLPLYKRASR
jgi:uncharacterized protein (DUF934 family)